MTAVNKVNLSSKSEKFMMTKFEARKLHIDYIYEKNSVQTEIQVLHCPFENFTQEELALIRKKTYITDSVFFWIDFPKIIHRDRMV